MADESTSKPPFWSSLPGMLTGLGAVIVAVTGLISALYSTGVIGTNANVNSNAAGSANTSSAKLASTPAPVNSEYERYQALHGNWEVTETPALDFNDIEKVTKRYEAAVAGNVLTLSGKIVSIDDDKNLSEEDENLTSTLVTPLAGSGGIGEYRVKFADGTISGYATTIRLSDDLKRFNGTLDIDGKTYKLTGRKL